MVYDPDEYARRLDEDRLRDLRELTESTRISIVSGHLTLREAVDLMDSTRTAAAQIIPDKMDVYDLVYGARYIRLIQQWICQPNGGYPPLDDLDSNV